MIGKLIRYAFKYTILTLGISYLTYNSHDKINHFINNVKFYTHFTEEGFVKKDHGFDLRLVYELNGKGNLETYVKSYSSNLPVFQRNNGIMIGSPEYNFSNFTYDEASELCKSKLKELPDKINTKPNIKKRALELIYDLFGEENGK